MDKDAFISLLTADRDIVRILEIIETLELPQACLCAGTIRTHVWNTLSGNASSYSGDVDVVFFDSEISLEATTAIENHLKKHYPKFDWEVKNQAHMHLFNGASQPYLNVADALGKFPEICTAVGIRKIKNDFELIAPHGIEDLLKFIVRLTPYFLASP